MIAGELHVTDFDDDGNETGIRIRRVGDYSHTVEPDVHMERGAPKAPSPCSICTPPTVTDVLADDHSVIRTNTVEQVARRADPSPTNNCTVNPTCELLPTCHPHHQPHGHCGINVVITGGSSGIGLAFARHHSELGHKVTLVGRDVAALEEARIVA